MVLKKRRSRSTKRSSKTKNKSTASKAAGKNDAGKAMELRDEQNGGVVTEESGREGIIDYFLGLPNEIEATVTSVLNCPTWCMDVAANDVDGIAAILEEEVGSNGNAIQSEEVSREKAKKAAKKKEAYLKAIKEEKQKEAVKKALEEEKQKEAEKKAIEEEKQKEAEKVAQKEAVVQKETKKEAAARKKAEKNAMKAAKKAAKEEDKNTVLMKTNPPPPPVMQIIEETDKNQVDESDIEKLLLQLQEEQKQLSDVDKKRTDVEAKIFATIKMIKNAANEAEMDSMIQENDSLREILTWENSCSFDDGIVTETSSFISAEDKEFIDVVADKFLCIGI